MDKCSGKEGRCQIQKLTAILILLGLCVFYLATYQVYAAEGPQQEEENKIEIELEKQSIVAHIEHPSIVFPVRWKTPDIPEERAYILRQDFREEIKKIIETGDE